MGEVIKFTGKRLSGFIPDPENPNLPEPFAENLKEICGELAALVMPDEGPDIQYCAIQYCAPPDDCA